MTVIALNYFCVVKKSNCYAVRGNTDKKEERFCCLRGGKRLAYGGSGIWKPHFCCQWQILLSRSLIDPHFKWVELKSVDWDWAPQRGIGPNLLSRVADLVNTSQRLAPVFMKGLMLICCDNWWGRRHNSYDINEEIKFSQHLTTSDGGHRAIKHRDVSQPPHLRWASSS